MKHVLYLLAITLFSFNSFAENEFETAIEAEMSINGSEEARVEAAEQKRLLREEKARKEKVKQQSAKAAEEAKVLELEAARESRNAHNSTKEVQAEVNSFLI